jgi:hypothetical protein
MNACESENDKGYRSTHRDEDMEHFVECLNTLKRSVVKSSMTARFWLEVLGIIGLFGYVGFAGAQWCSTNRQLGILASQVEVEKHVARLGGLPLIKMTGYMQWYELGPNTKDLHISVMMQNYGKHIAASVAGAAYVEFRSTIPEQGRYNFAPDDFTPINDGVLYFLNFDELSDQLKANQKAGYYRTKERQVSSEEYQAYTAGKTSLYVWGVVKYKDFTGGEAKTGFCRYLSVNNIAAIGETAYTCKFSNCDEQAPSSYFF